MLEPAALTGGGRCSARSAVRLLRGCRESTCRAEGSDRALNIVRTSRRRRRSSSCRGGGLSHASVRGGCCNAAGAAVGSTRPGCGGLSVCLSVCLLLPVVASGCCFLASSSPVRHLGGFLACLLYAAAVLASRLSPAATSRPRSSSSSTKQADRQPGSESAQPSVSCAAASRSSASKIILGPCCKMHTVAAHIERPLR